MTHQLDELLVCEPLEERVAWVVLQGPCARPGVLRAHLMDLLVPGRGDQGVAVGMSLDGWLHLKMDGCWVGLDGASHCMAADSSWDACWRPAGIRLGSETLSVRLLPSFRGSMFWRHCPPTGGKNGELT